MKIIILLSFTIFFNSVYAEKPETLQELLDYVKQTNLLEKEVYKKREKQFKESFDQQKTLLTNIQNELKEVTENNSNLKIKYNENEQLLSKQQTLLENKMGSLNELNGVVRTIASDLDAIISSSFISSEFLGRDEILKHLINRKELPSLQELEKLWLLTMQEMVESSRISTFESKIVTASGNEIEAQVTRIGVFNAIVNGNFLHKIPETGKLIEPSRQPERRFLKMAKELKEATSGMHAFPIDPTRGAMLDLLVQTPDLKNRILQGGIVGYMIIFIGFIGFLIAIERFIVLVLAERTVKLQLKNNEAGANPLGRIMQVYTNNTNIDTETLSLKLDEAILKEIPKLQRGLGALALLASVAPLLGLLGTVTGIIETFQSITLYGTGDPRIMSGGISQALVTTVEGLLVAIPLLLIHSFLSSKSNQLIQVLDEKSTAFIAMLAENNHSLKNA